jgi:membrane protein DedA with SNARE-associated domain
MDVLDSLLDILRAPLDAYRWLVQEAVGLVRDLFQDYGYLVVFLGTCLENMLFLGLFVPGIFVLLLAGISAENGLISFPVALVVGIVGTSLGDTVSYLAGRFGWKRALEHTRNVPWMDTIQAALKRHPAWFVLAYHFMGYTRLVGPILAGAFRLSPLRWWLLDLGGAVLWVATYLSLGYLFGRLGFELDEAEDNVRRLEWLFAALAIAGLVFWVLMRRRSGRGEPPAVLEALADGETTDAPDALAAGETADAPDADRRA